MDPAIAFVGREDTSSSYSEVEDDTIVHSVVVSCSALLDCVSGLQKRKFMRRSWFYDNIDICSDKEFQQDIRITREAYHWLLAKLEKSLKNLSVGPNTVVPKKQLLSTIWVATPDCYRSVAKQFGMSRSTLQKCVRRVVEKINELASTLIKWPSGEERMNIKRQMRHWGNIPGVVGAIDGIFIPIKAPVQNPEVYNNRKCFNSITLQAICNHERKFTDIFVGYRSSVGDARIFRNSDIVKAAINQFLVDYDAEGQNFVIGDEDEAEANAREQLDVLRVEGQHLRDQIAENLLRN